MKNWREKIASKHVITKKNSATLYTTSHLSQVTSNGSGDGNNRVVVALTVTPQHIQRRRGNRRSRCQFQIHFSFSRDCKANITFDRCVRPKYNQQPTTVRIRKVKSVFNINQKLELMNMIGIVTNCNKFYWEKISEISIDDHNIQMLKQKFSCTSVWPLCHRRTVWDKGNPFRPIH